jgi:hypothetical protein
MTTNSATTRKPRIWMALTVNLIVIALVVLLLRSRKYFTYEQLAEVRVYMTVDEAHQLLGPSLSLEDYQIQFGSWRIPPSVRVPLGEPSSTIRIAMVRFAPSNPFFPTIVTTQRTSLREDLPPALGRLWLGRDHLLWIQVDEQNRIRDADILTYREEGGGGGPWLKQQYTNWRLEHVDRGP